MADRAGHRRDPRRKTGPIKDSGQLHLADSREDSTDSGLSSRGNAGVIGGEERVIVKPSSQWTRERRFTVTGHFGSEASGLQRFYRCTEIPSGKQFLLKRVLLEQSQSQTKRWQRDITSWSQLSHAHILPYRDAWQTRDWQHVLCAPALMPLSDLLQAMVPDKPCQHLFASWLVHILSALEYMHEQHVEEQPMLYRNLHPDGIVVTDQCSLQLCHFADSKQLEHQQGTARTIVGQGLFQSPEIARGQPYDKSTDIWSAGVVSIFIADYVRANKAGSVERLRQILADRGYGHDVQRVVLKALQANPAKRPGASQLVHDLVNIQGLGDLQAPIPPSLYPSPLRTSGDHSHAEKDRGEDTVLTYRRTLRQPSTTFSTSTSEENYEDDEEEEEDPSWMTLPEHRELKRYVQSGSLMDQHHKWHGQGQELQPQQPSDAVGSSGLSLKEESAPGILAEEDLSGEDASPSGGPSTAIHHPGTLSRKNVVAAIAAVKSRSGVKVATASRVGGKAGQMFLVSGARSRSRSPRKAIDDTFYSRITEAIKNQGRRQGKAAVGKGDSGFEVSSRSGGKSRQDTEMTSGLGDSLSQLSDTDLMLYEQLCSKQSGPPSRPPTAAMPEEDQLSSSQRVVASPSVERDARALGTVLSERSQRLSISTQSSSVSRTSSSSSSISLELRMPPEMVSGRVRAAGRSEDRDNAERSPEDPSQHHWLQKDSAGTKSNLLVSYTRTSGTQTDKVGGFPPPPPPPPSPLFCGAWQTQATFTSAGGTMSPPRSDVMLVIPRRAVEDDRQVTVHSAVCANVEYISKEMGLDQKEGEIMVSPLAEFFSHEDLRFQRPVEICLPHALPRNADINRVRVYQVVRDSHGYKNLSRLPHKATNISTTTTTTTATTTTQQEVAREDTDRLPTTRSTDTTSQRVLRWYKGGSFHMTSEGRVVVLTTHFSAYVCTYCGHLNTGPVVLQVLATGNHRLKDPHRHSANVHVHVWDDRLLVRDFREQYGMGQAGFKELDRTSLTLTDDVKGSQLSLRLTVIGEEETRYWTHCKASDGSPGLLEERVYSIERVLGCDNTSRGTATPATTSATPCPAASGSRLRPLEAKWKLESHNPSPPHLWFQCVVDICHVLSPRAPSSAAGDPREQGQQATPSTSRVTHGGCLSVEMEAPRDACGAGGREGLQHLSVEDLHRLVRQLFIISQEPPAPVPGRFGNESDYKDELVSYIRKRIASGGGQTPLLGEQQRKQTMNQQPPAQAEVLNNARRPRTTRGQRPDRQTGLGEDHGDSLPSSSTLDQFVRDQLGPPSALVDHPDNIPPQEPSWPPEMPAMLAVQHDERVFQQRSPCQHEEKPGCGSLQFFAGSLERQLHRLLPSPPVNSKGSSTRPQPGVVPSSSSSGVAQQGRSPGAPQGLNNRPRSSRSTTTRGENPDVSGACSSASRTQERHGTRHLPGVKRPVRSEPSQGGLGTEEGCSGEISTQHVQSARPYGVSTTPQRRSSTPCAASNTPQGQSSAPSCAPSTLDRRSERALSGSNTRHRRSTTPRGRTNPQGP